MTNPTAQKATQLALAKLPAPARALSEWLASKQWDFEAAAQARGTEPRLLYREWLESLGWNQSLAARLYRRRGTGGPVTRQAIEAQMKKYGVSRPPDYRGELGEVDLEGALGVFADVRSAVQQKSSPERLACELLLALSDGYKELGEHQKARGALVEVVALARRAGSSELVERAVIALSLLTFQISPYGRYDRDMELLMEEWLPILREAGQPRALAICLARLGYEVHMSGELIARERSAKLTAEAVEVSRGSACPHAICSSAGYRCATIDGPHQLQERISLLETVFQRIDIFDSEHRYFLSHLRVSDLFEAGRIPDAQLLLDELRGLEPGCGAPWPQRYRATLAVLQGDWDEAQRLSAQTLDAPLDSAAQVRALQQFEAMKQLGQWDTLANLVRWTLTQDPSAPIGWQIAFGLVNSLLGRLDVLGREFETWFEGDFASVDEDMSYISNLCSLAEIAHALEHEKAAAVLYEKLTPFRERLCMLRVMACMRAPVARYLGLLASTLGDRDRAHEDFESSLEMCRRLRARPYLTWTQYDLARMLLTLGNEPQEAKRLAREAAEGAARLRMTWLAERAGNL